MPDDPMPDIEQTMQVPMVAVPTLPFRYLITADSINGQPAAHLLIALPNVTVRITMNEAIGFDIAREIRDALLGTPAKKGGLTVVETGGLIVPDGTVPPPPNGDHG